MKKRKYPGIQLFHLAILVVISAFLISWGRTGHYHISYNASLSFNSEMEQFEAWTSILASHASDADDRKDEDPEEGHKHYIDIDNYSEFIENGFISQDIDSLIAIYGSGFVDNQGILPWATLASYDSLIACFERRDWDKAVLFASDLGHYVADGHMPLHLTRNYNGQYSDNYGIHYRYESLIINAYISEFIYEGKEIDSISDVSQYIFDYIYENYVFIDSVLEADDYATSVNSDTYSSQYKQALWDETKDFTIPIFSEASHAITELIYTAWLTSGKPMMNDTIVSDTTINDTTLNINEGLYHFVLRQNMPNPFVNSTTIRFYLKQSSDVLLQIFDMNGNLIETLIEDDFSTGDYSVIWDASGQKAGIYFMNLRTTSENQIKKMVLLE